jgi:hypothetical protein
MTTQRTHASAKVPYPRDHLRGDHRVSHVQPVVPTSAVVPRRLPKETLKAELLSHVQLLKQRRCAEIAEGYIDGYVALNWMEWNGGSLQLTVTGDNVRRQLTAGLG